MRPREEIEADTPPRSRHGTVTIGELLLEVMLDSRDLLVAGATAKDKKPKAQDDDD